jgi:hypothetical protein
MRRRNSKGNGSDRNGSFILLLSDQGQEDGKGNAGIDDGMIDSCNAETDFFLDFGVVCVK